MDDCYVKVFTGDDEMADDLEPQFVLNVDKLFPAKMAAQLKAAVGKSMWQAIHIPTTVSRTCDGGTTSRWSAMQIGMSFIGAYKMCAGEAAVADLAFAAKHAGVIQMADILPARRARGPNEPGGIKFGHFADMVQSDRKYPNDPIRSSLEIVAAGTMLFDQIWLGSYMSGGVGFTQYATAAYTDNILDDYTHTVWTTSRRNTVALQRQRRPRKSSATSQPRSTSTVWSSTRHTRPHSRATSAVPSVHPSLQQHPVSPLHLERQTPTLA